MNWYYLAVIIVYILAIFGISYWRSRGIKSQEEFMVAGRSAPAWLLVGSLICTWIGAGSLIGGGGKIYRDGISQLWMSAGAWVAIIVIFFLADKVRKMSKFTVQDILEKRYHPMARVLGSVAVIFGSVIIFAYQLKGMSYVLEEIFAVPMFWGILITGLLIFGFTTFAGLKSILAMDVLNGALIILAIFIGLPMMLSIVGDMSAVETAAAGGTSAGGISAGVTHVMETLPETHFSWFGSHNIFWAFGAFFPTMFLLLGESSIYQKFYSAKSGKAVKTAVIGFFVGVVVVEIVLALFAMAATSHPEFAKWRNTHDAYVESVDVGAPQVEQIQKWDALVGAVITSEADRANFAYDKVEDHESTATNIYNNRTDSINLLSAFELPFFAGALLLAGGMAIVFSTSNSFLMAASTSFTRDIWQRFIDPDISEKKIVVVQRLTMLTMVGVAVGLLIIPALQTTVWQMALAAYTIIGSALTPVILAAFLWKRVTSQGGVASLATGLFCWTLMVTLKMSGIWAEFDYDLMIYFAGIPSIAALIIVSLLTPPSDPELVKEFTGR